MVYYPAYMNAKEIIDSLSRKGADREEIAATVLDNPGAIPVLLEALGAKKANVKYGAERVLRLISEKRPELLYPHFDRFTALLEAENKFLKWGAIIAIANLASVDSEKRIERIFDRYFAPIAGPVMVTAANIVGGASKIAKAKPELAGRIVAEIIKVENARYSMHGQLSPECNHVICGHSVDVLTEIFDQVPDKRRVRDFIERQLQNPRPAVRKKANTFFKNQSELGDG